MTLLLRRIKNKFFIITCGLILTMLFCYLYVTKEKYLQYVIKKLDYSVYDAQTHFFFPRKIKKDNPVIIVDVDEKSVQKLGRWPWSREVLAKVLKSLQDSGVIVVAFDMIFSEQEVSIIEKVVSKMKKEGRNNKALNKQLLAIKSLFQPDAAFASSLRDYEVILGYTFRSSGQAQGQLAPPLVTLPSDRSDKFTMLSLPSYSANIPILQRSATQAGFVTTQVDDDGLLRRIPLMIRHKNNVYASIALQLVKQYFAEENVKLNYYQQDQHFVIEGVTIGGRTYDTDELGQVLVPYFGDRGTIPYISVIDLLEGKVAPEKLDGKIAIVGSTLLGLADFQATPVNSIYPGVEAQASVAVGLIDYFLPFEPPWANGLVFFALVLSSVLASLVYPFLRLWLLNVFSLVSLFILFYVQWHLWHYYGLFISMVVPAISLASISLLNLFYGYITEGRKRKQLRNIFSEYVPPEYAAQVSEKKKMDDFDGETRDISVLFMDIEGFTTLSEKLTARQVKQLLNYYLTPLTKAIFDHQGTIDKYIGDAIMAFWGAPLENEQHRLDACLGAIDMMAAVEQHNTQKDRPRLPTISIKLGLHCGEANVGDMGSSYRRAYTAIGDVVNTSARMEAATRQYGISVMVSEQMIQGLDQLLVIPVDKVIFKGKNEPLTIYELIGIKGKATPDLEDQAEIASLAFETYMNRQFERSKELYQFLYQKQPQKILYTLYLDRIDKMLENPIGDQQWNNGITKLFEK